MLYFPGNGILNIRAIEMGYLGNGCMLFLSCVSPLDKKEFLLSSLDHHATCATFVQKEVMVWVLCHASSSQKEIKEGCFFYKMYFSVLNKTIDSPCASQYPAGMITALQG